MDSPHSPAFRFIDLGSTEETRDQPAAPTHNAKYYIDDTVSIFLVENQLFKIHRHFLVKESDVFRRMFHCPPGSSGSSNARVIPLPGVTAEELEALLDFFYTEEFQRNEAQMQAWIELLSIATRFDFQRLRECAIDAIEHSRWPFTRRRVESIDPIKQIVLAEKHDIPHWLPIAYAALCQRPNSLEEWEAEQIGYRKTTLLARAREAVRDQTYNPHIPVNEPQPVPSPPTGYWVVPNASEGFAESLADKFYMPHQRNRVETIVDEVFFPSPRHGSV